MNLQRFLVSVSLISTLALAACVGGGTSATGGGALIPSSSVRLAATQSVQASLPNVSGWYAGRITESVYGHTINSGLTISVKQSAATFTGIMNPYYDHHTVTLRISGQVFKTAKGAWLKFTIHLPAEGSVPGSGTVTGKDFNGKATVSHISITFTSVKSK